MEISRYSKSVVAVAESAGTVRSGNAGQSAQQPSSKRVKADSMPLEQMQENLRALPDVDLAKVQEIKQALQRGEIATDPAGLAAAILAFHRGSGA